jgi:hypothetical protein
VAGRAYSESDEAIFAAKDGVDAESFWVTGSSHVLSVASRDRLRLEITPLKSQGLDPA